MTSTHGTLEADEILVASGRRHVTEDLGLEAVGLDAGAAKPIEVGDDLRVAGHDWLYVDRRRQRQARC